jgi:CO/xanthine dehydrogenase Mo-binding subunit
MTTPPTHRVIGRSLRRVEGAQKVTGATVFTGDLSFHGLGFAKLVLAPHPHARIGDVDVEAARRMPGVVAVVTARDLPPLKASDTDLPLAAGHVVYVGQPVAAVIAESREAAEDAAQLVSVEYEPMPHVVDVGDATAAGAPEVLRSRASALDDAAAHGGGSTTAAETTATGNVIAVHSIRQGDADAALRASAQVVQATYESAGVHHCPMEPHVVVARPEPDGGFTVWTPTQGMFAVRQATAAILGLDPALLRIVPMPVGGGFGGKICLFEPLVVVLARHCGRAVLLELTRTEEFLAGRGAPGAVVSLRLGADERGMLTAVDADVRFDNGACAGGLGSFAGLMLAGTYRIPNYRVDVHEVATHKTPVQAYRAPGMAQVYFALESAMDELATQLGQDPIELRLANAVQAGDLRPDGLQWPAIGLIEVLRAAQTHPLYTERRTPGEGVGIAVGGWGGGREPAVAHCRLDAGGGLLVEVGTSDISGTDTTLTMLAAEAFGVSSQQVRIERGDTRTSPCAGGAGGSKIIYSVGPAVWRAAADARAQVLQAAGELLEVGPADLEIVDGEVRVLGAPARSVTLASVAHATTAYGSRLSPIEGSGRVAISEQAPMFTAHLARVRVDRETGAWAVTGYAVIQDVGRALNPAEIEAQIHGGNLQALGRALGEAVVHSSDGQPLTASFVDYAIPTIDQAPPVESLLIEVPAPDGPLGARGVGEPPAIPAPAAIANAIASACGVRLRQMPVKLEDLVTADVERTQALSAPQGGQNEGQL